MTIIDHEIQAYVDGELAPEDAARIDAAIAADVMVAARIDRERRLRAMLRGAFDPVLSEPVPERLRGLLSGEGSTSPEAARSVEADVVDLRARRADRASRWRTPVFAMAASVAALAVSLWLRPGTPVQMQDGRLVARGELARELDDALAGAPEAGAGTSVALTFRDNDGRICRSFAHRATATAGLACRDGDRWLLPVVTRMDAGGADALRQASTAIPVEVQAAVDARLEGEVFDAEQERAARDAGWR